MKVVISTSDIYEAEIIKGLLEENGIVSVLQTDSANGMRPSLNFSTGANILVRDEDFDRALAIIQAAA